jgi:hypothetical protein
MDTLITGIRCNFASSGTTISGVIGAALADSNVRGNRERRAVHTNREDLAGMRAVVSLNQGFDAASQASSIYGLGNLIF